MQNYHQEQATKQSKVWRWMSRTAKALTGQLDSLHESSSIRAGCDGERLDANWVRTAPTELLPAIVVTSS